MYAALDAPPAKHHNAWILLVLAVLVAVNVYVFVLDKRGVAAIKREAETMTIPAAPLDAGSASDPQAAPSRAHVIEGRVDKSDTPGRLLKKSGLTAAEADEVIRALTGVLDFRTLRPGQRYRIERGPDGRVKSFELELSKSHRVRAERTPAGEMTGRTIGLADPALPRHA